MKTKMIENYVYDGLGFPIELEKVEMVYVNQDWHPKIDVHHIADQIIMQLAIQASRLTGNQIKFIRSYFSMSLREFGNSVAHATHMAVSKWEKKGDEITAMNESTEQVIRLYILEKKRDDSAKSDFYKDYQKSKRFFNAKEKIGKALHIKNCA
ncbi:MAG: hypothetical protein NTW08_01045 [Gammaproteobacteria bacterium]|nr:hypothetical protein [Gammaproteobacteria bacterium]